MCSAIPNNKTPAKLIYENELPQSMIASSSSIASLRRENIWSQYDSAIASYSRKE
jgi:hypothetical protein